MTPSSRPISTSTLASACAWPHADRAIFLRICEDRGIEDYGTLQNLIGKPGVYRRLMERFEDADDRQPTACGLQLTALVGYGVSNRPEPLAVSRKPMADVLGEVYEQFLGKVIRLTPGHQAKVEERRRSLFPPVHLTGRPPRVNCPRCHANPVRT